MLDFTGKTVLVTGGGAGIGRAIAEAFGRTGASVVVAELDAGRVADTRAALEGAGVDALVSQTDVRDRAAVDALMEQVKARFGGLDVLVNNVGDFLGIAKPFQYVTDEELDAYIKTLEVGSPAFYDAVIARVLRHRSAFPVVGEDPEHARFQGERKDVGHAALLSTPSTFSPRHRQRMETSVRAIRAGGTARRSASASTVLSLTT